MLLRQVTLSSQIPQRPSPNHVTLMQYHAMQHYNHCIVTWNDLQEVVWTARSIEENSLKSAEQIFTDVLGLTDRMGEYKVTISDNKVMIALTLTTRLARFLVKSVRFEDQGHKIEATALRFMPKAENHDQVGIRI